MEEKEAHPEDSIEYILESIVRLLSQDRRTNVRDTDVAREPSEIYASAEEGARLIRAFIRIEQPELRDAIINLATQMANISASMKPLES